MIHTYHTTNDELIDYYFFKVIKKYKLRELTCDYFEWMLNFYKLRVDKCKIYNDVYIDFMNENLSPYGYNITISNVNFNSRFRFENSKIKIMKDGESVFSPVFLSEEKNKNYIDILENFLEKNYGTDKK